MRTSLLLLFALSVAPAALADELAAARRAGCMGCHLVDRKLVGPAFKDIAAKYRGRADAVRSLADTVRSGSQGVWGPIPMPANPPQRIADGDLKAVIQWVLKN